MTQEHILPDEVLRAKELEATINRSPSMVFRWKAQADFPVVFVSANVSQLGFSADDFLSGRVEWLKLTHPDDVPRLERELEAHAARGCDDFPMEYRLFNREGHVRWMSDHTHALRDDTGVIRYYESVITDTTESKRIGEALRQTTEELARSNRDLEQFAYVASHDLQEPIRQVQAFAQLIQERYAGTFDDKVLQYFQFIQEGAARVSELVHGLLEYSRVKAQATAPEPVSCGWALQQALANLQSVISESQARITCDELPMVTGEAVQLLQLFQNLISNAVKFRRAGIPPVIHVGCRLDGANWIVGVTDNGIGIDPQYHAKIFMIFQRLQTREQYPGNGIGLAICKKIVERHGGRIWVESEAGVKSTFFFTLPDVKEGGSMPRVLSHG